MFYCHYISYHLSYLFCVIGVTNTTYICQPCNSSKWRMNKTYIYIYIQTTFQVKTFYSFTNLFHDHATAWSIIRMKYMLKHKRLHAALINNPFLHTTNKTSGYYGGIKFDNNDFFLCLHSLASSFLVFKLDISGLQIIKYFSLRHKLHFLLPGEYELHFAIILQSIE